MVQVWQARITANEAKIAAERASVEATRAKEDARHAAEVLLKVSADLVDKEKSTK